MTKAFARLVWTKLVTEIIAATLGLKAVAMLLSWYELSRNRNHGFPRGFPWTRLGYSGFLMILGYLLVNIFTVAFTFYISMGYMNSPPFSMGAAPRESGDRTFVLGILIFQNGFHAILVVREYLEANFFEQLEGLSEGKPSYIIKFSHVHFIWNLGLHQLVSAWLGTAMLDRYLIGSLASGRNDFVPTIITDCALSGHTGANIYPGLGGLFNIFGPFWITVAQAFAVFILYAIFAKQDVPLFPSGSLFQQPSHVDLPLRPLRSLLRNRSDRQYGTMNRKTDRPTLTSFSKIDVAIPSSTLSVSFEDLENEPRCADDLYVMSGALQDD